MHVGRPEKLRGRPTASIYYYRASDTGCEASSISNRSYAIGRGRQFSWPVGDQRIIRLVRKWLKAGVLEDGELSVSETDTPQGSMASPLFANV